MHHWPSGNGNNTIVSLDLKLWGYTRSMVSIGHRAISSPPHHPSLGNATYPPRQGPGDFQFFQTNGCSPVLKQEAREWLLQDSGPCYSSLRARGQDCLATERLLFCLIPTEEALFDPSPSPCQHHTS